MDHNEFHFESDHPTCPALVPIGFGDVLLVFKLVPRCISSQK